MSKSQINLRGSDIDLLVGSTQNSINASIKQNLNSIKPSSITATRYYDTNNMPVREEIVAQIVGDKDIFNLDENRDGEIIKCLCEKGIACGFYASMGCVFGLDNIQFLEQKSFDEVCFIFTMPFKKFKYFEIVTDNYRTLEDEDCKKWKFSVNGHVSCVDGKTSKNIKLANYSPEVVFKTVLATISAGDFQTINFSSELVNFPDSKECLTDFLQLCYSIIENNDCNILGFLVIPKDLNKDSSTILGLNYIPSNEGLTTLNFYSKLDGQIPKNTKCTTQLVEVSDESKFNGVAAVSSTSLAKSLLNSIQYSLNTLSMKPSVKYYCNLFTLEIGFSYCFTNEPVNVELSNTDYLNIKYHNEGHDHGFAGEFGVKYDVNGSVKKKANSTNVLDLEVNVVCYGDLSFLGSSSSGNLSSHTIQAEIALNILDDGRLQADIRNIHDNDNGSTFEFGTWAKILTFDTIESLKDSLTKMYNEGISSAISRLNHYLSSVNIGWCFFMPCTGTYSFSNLQIENSNDVTLELQYKSK